jgi:hypothetical protein
MTRFSTWIGSLFVYRLTQFGFRTSTSEQRLWLAALGGRTVERTRTSRNAHDLAFCSGKMT